MATRLRFESVSAAGHSAADWHPQGACVVVGGADGFLQAVPVSLSAADAAGKSRRRNTHSAVVSVAFHPSGTEVCVACADRSVSLYDYPSLDMVRVLMAVEADVVQVAYSPSGGYVAVADARGGVSLVSTAPGDVTRPTRCRPPSRTASDGNGDDDNDDEDDEEDEDEEACPVLGLVFDPLNEFVCVLYASGALAVFSTADGTRVCVRQRVRAALPATKTQRCVPDWRGDGSLIAVPTERGVSFVAARSSTQERWSVYADDEFAEGTKNGTTHCAWCANGKYLATVAAAEGAVLVWDVHEGRPSSIAKTTAKQAPLLWCKWAPSANAMALLDGGGNMAVWEDVVPRFLPQPAGSTTEDTSKGAAGANQSTTRRPVVVVGEKELFPAGENDDEQDEDKDKEKQQKKAQSGSSLGDGDDVGDGSEQGDDVEDIEDEDDDEDEAKRRARKAKSQRGGAAAVRLQEPFQPNASPMERQRRFLAFNELGSLVVGEQDGESVFVVEHEGTGGAQRRQIINNSHNCTMGSLCKFGFAAASRDCVVFHTTHTRHQQHTTAAAAAAGLSAALTEAQQRQQESGDDDTPVCDWVRELPEDEAVLGLAASSTGVCVATSRAFLRLFSLTGMQRVVLAVPGSHVCVVARDAAFVEVYQEACTGAYRFFCFTVAASGTAHVCYDGSLPLGAGESLLWAGLSDALALAVLGSRGMLLMRIEGSKAALWMPMLDFAQLAGRKRGALAHWMVAVSGSEALCVQLREGELVPPTAPPPVVCSLALTPPVVQEARDAETGLVVQLLRDRVLLEHRIASGTVEADAVPRAEAKLDVLQLQLIEALAHDTAEPTREQRILGLCHGLALRRSLAIAAKFINNAGLTRLANTVADMYERTAPPPQQQQQQQQQKEEEQQQQAQAHQDQQEAASAKPPRKRTRTGTSGK